MNYCANCGAQMPEYSVFCAECGWKKGTEIKLEQHEEKEKSNNLDNKKDYKSETKNSYVTKSKKKSNVPGAFLFILILLILGGGGVFVYKNLINRSGKFKNVDGIDTYYEGYEIGRNKLVRVDNDEYYIDNNGHKIINDLLTIDINGNLAYFDESGKRLVNSFVYVNGAKKFADSNGMIKKNTLFTFDGNKYFADSDGNIIINNIKKADNKLYYFGPDGKMCNTNGWQTFNNEYIYILNGQVARNAWVDSDYYVGDDGKMKRNTWVDTYYYVGEDGKYVRNQKIGEYYCGSDGKYVTNCTIDGIVYDSKGVGTRVVAIQSPTITPNQQQTTNNYSANSTVINNSNNNTSISATNSNEELYIAGNKNITDSYEDNKGNTCKITIKKPIMAGRESEEVSAINDVIEEKVNEIMEELLQLASTYAEAPKSISLTNVERTTLTASRCRITFSGKLTPRSGSQKTVKYRISYEREDGVGDYENLTN